MEIRPIFSALMRSKVSMILIGVQVAMTLAIVCNALFIIGQRLDHMSRPSGMNEADTFYLGSSGLRPGLRSAGDDARRSRDCSGSCRVSPTPRSPIPCR